MTARAASPWWRALFGGGGASDDDETGPIVVDPTSQLLRTVSHVESRMPWGLVGVLIAVALWLPTVAGLSGPWDGDAGPETDWGGAAPGPERAWVGHVLGDAAPGPSESAATWSMLHAAWRALGVPDDPAAVGPADRRLLRIPSSVFALLGLIVLFALGRQITGNAPAVLAISLAGISAPWTRAASSALPLAPGEALTLAGVAWAIAVQARHREVGVAAVSVRRIGGSGVLIGIGLLFAPAHFATLLAVVLVWLFLALRRASSLRTTLPVPSPAASTFFAVAGTVILVACAAAVGWGAEMLAGGRGFPYAAGFGVHLEAGRDIWIALWRGFLSPSAATDRLVLAALPAIAVVRVAEWSVGKPWRASGLLPWAFLALYFLAFVRGQAQVSDLVVPLVVPPLFVLGLGWLVLRGLHPGRARRQEYSFLLVWLAVGLAIVPFVPSASAHDPRLAVFLALLPPVVLMAGRAGRALWEVDDHPLARIAVFVLVYLPVLAWAGRGAVDALGLSDHGLVAALTGRLPLVALVTVVLGAGSELFRVGTGVRPRRPPRRSAGESGAGGGGRRGGRTGRGRTGGSRTGGSRTGGRGERSGRTREGGADDDGTSEGRRGGRGGGGRSGGRGGSRGGGRGGARGPGGRRRRTGRRDGGSR